MDLCVYRERVQYLTFIGSAGLGPHVFYSDVGATVDQIELQWNHKLILRSEVNR